MPMSRGEVEFRRHYIRADLRREPRTLFVFGDNMAQRGLGGQAKEARGEPNAVGVPTKWSPETNKAAYFSDVDLAGVKGVLDHIFDGLNDHLRRGGKIVWPAKGVGTGLAGLPHRAPAIHAYITAKLAGLLGTGQ